MDTPIEPQQNPAHDSPLPESPQTQLESITARLVETEQSLEAARNALTRAEQRHAIDLALLESRPLDLDAARALVEQRIAAAPGTDPSEAVRELKRAKPHLFVPGSPSRAGAMGVQPALPETPVESAARRASQTGDRRALLSYLRIRRQTA